MEDRDRYEMQTVESLLKFARKLRSQGDEERAARCEKKAEKKRQKVLARQS